MNTTSTGWCHSYINWGAEYSPMQSAGTGAPNVYSSFANTVTSSFYPTAYCWGYNGGPDLGWINGNYVTALAPPTGSISASPNPVPYGGNTTISLNTTATGWCHSYINWGAEYSPVQSTGAGAPNVSSSFNSGTITSSFYPTAYCWGYNGSNDLGWVNSYITVNPAPTASIAQSTTGDTVGASYTVSWSSNASATSCTVYLNINGSGWGPWAWTTSGSATANASTAGTQQWKNTCTNGYVSVDSPIVTHTVCSTGYSWNGSVCSINSYTVSTSIGGGGTGGSISPSYQSVTHGSATTFTVSPNAGYTIATASGCGGSLSGTTFTTGAITSACTVSASFTKSLPTQGTVSINTATIVPNNANSYTITMSGSDGGGAGNIIAEYALINLQGENGGTYRGYLTWGAGDWWPGYQDHHACSGSGGYAVVQPGYGNSYIHFDSCSVSDSGNTRTVSFVVRFDPTYISPIIDNDISGLVYDNIWQSPGWVNFDTNFNIATYPLAVSASGSGTVGGAGTYVYGSVITATASASAGSTFTGWSGDCNGSGQVTMTAAKNCVATFTANAPIVPSFYISGSTWGIADGSTSGITYGGGPYTLSWGATSYTTSCTLDGAAVAVGGGSSSGTASFAGNTHTFTLSCSGPGGTVSRAVTISYPPPPTNASASCSADGSTGTISWTAPGGYTTFYTRASSGGANLGYPAWDDGFVGTVKTFTTTPGATYSWWIHTKETSNSAWSTAPSGSFTCASSCPAAAQTWSSCSGSTVAKLSSQSSTVTNGTTGYSGSATYTCSNGAWSLNAGSTCSTNSYTLTITSNGGTITGTPRTTTGAVNYGTAVSLSQTPPTGYFFNGWSGGSCSGTGACSFTMPAANASVTAGYTAYTVSVSATTPYNTTPNTNVSFAYTPSTNSGATECRLLDNAQSPLTVYQASSPIVYASANGIGAYGYYVQCRNTTAPSVTAISNAITVNTACVAGAHWSAGASACLTDVAIGSFTPTSASIVNGASTNLNWSGVTGGGTISCSIDNGIGAATPAASGSKSTGSLLTTTTFTLTCSNGVGPDASRATTVTVAANQAPTAPTITGPTTGIPNTSYTYTFTSTDPEGDSLHYEIDWDNNGTVDQTLPAGWVSSGTTQSQANNWASTGTKIFKARAVDSKASAGISGWTTYTVTLSCANGTNNPPTCTQCPDGQGYNGSVCAACTGGCSGTGGNTTGSPLGSISCSNGTDNPLSCNAYRPSNIVLTANPTTIDNGQSTRLSWSSVGADSCYPVGGEGSGFSTGGAPSNAVGVATVPPTLVSNQDYQLTCTGPGGTATSNIASVTVLQPQITTFRATPARVAKIGDPATISWNVVQVNSCTVTGSGYSSGVLPGPTVSGSHTITHVNAQQTYTITCQTNGADISTPVTINVPANLKEF
ncbi:MAG: hypothetical protein PHD04_01905 [Candidatus Pacebacteria bacterium]|nr:hypothetical protein [Candidatus Paceibacterota bacterium]